MKNLIQSNTTPRRGAMLNTAIAMLTFAMSINSAWAADVPPSRMSFQSYLADDSGNPVGSGTPVNKKMIFTLFDADTGGVEQWADEQIVTVNNGYFSVILGEGSQVSSFNHDLSTAFSNGDSSVSDRFLQITVSDTDGSNSEIITPRMRMLPSAYAFMSTFAKTAESLSTPAPTSSIQDSAITNAKIGNSAVNSSKIEDGSVFTVDLADGAVTSNKVLDGTIATSDIADNAITSSKIKNSEVKGNHLAANSVGTGQLINGGVKTADIDSRAVTLDKIQTGLFQFRTYSQSLTGTSDWVTTSYPVGDWYPVLMGFSFGTVDIDENGDKTAWTIVPQNAEANWRFRVRGPTHNDKHIDLDLFVMWIPSSLVSSN